MNMNMEEAERLFDLVDTDKSGSLSRDEVKNIMAQLNNGVEPGPDEVKNAFQAMDRDGNGKIDKGEFLDAMSQWLRMTEEAEKAHLVGTKRLIGSPHGSPGGASSRKKATLSMASYFKQFAGDNGNELRRRIENRQPPGVELNVDLTTILRDYPNYSVAEKLSYFDEATEQMSVSTGLFVSLHSPQWEDIEVSLQVVGKFLEVVEIFHLQDEKVELWPLFDQIFTFFTACDNSGAIPGEPLSIIRRVAQLLRLPIPSSRQVQFYTLCLKALANYIPGPGFPCSTDSHWHPNAQLPRSIMRHEQLVPSLYLILKEHGKNLSSLETVRMLEAHAKCLQIFCETWFEIADIAISEFMREGVRMLLEAILAQKDGPIDATGKKYGLDAFAPLLQNLLGALAVLCGFTHEEGRSQIELFRLDEDETESIMTVTGVCIQFLTNCHVMEERQVALIYISIIWQYLLPILPIKHDLFTTVVNENIRLLGYQWDMSPAGIQVVVNLILSIAELMDGKNTSSAVYIALWDHTQSDFKNHFRRQFQVGFQGGLTTWPICQACYHVLLLLLERGQQDHLTVPTDAKDPMSYFGAIVFQQSRFLLTTAEDSHLIIDFLCKCLDKDDLIETLLSVGIVDSFFGFFSRFKINSQAISDIFNRHVAPTYEIASVTAVIIALKQFLTRRAEVDEDIHKAFTLDHIDSAELLHAVICRELRRCRLRMTTELEELIIHLEELVQMMVKAHVAGNSLIKDIMVEELEVMESKWPRYRDEAYKIGVARSLPKAVWMDIQTTPLWESKGMLGFDKSHEPVVFHDLAVSGIDFSTIKNELGLYYKRPIALFGTRNKSIVICNQEDLAKHMHRFVKDKNSTEKIYVEFFVDVEVGGELKQSQNYFDTGQAMGMSSKHNELQKLLANAGNDKEKLQSNRTIEAFYDYFKANGLEVIDEDTFTKFMVSADLGYELHTAMSTFKAFDSNHDGSLTLQEIAIGFSQLSSDNSKTRLKTLFKIYDLDKNEKLDKDELRDMIMKTTGKSIPDAEQMAEAAVAKQGADSGGLIDLEEFTRLARSGVIDLGIDFSRNHNMNDNNDSKHHGKGRGVKDSNSYQAKADSKSMLCSFLFTASGCNQGELCRFKHGDISQASRGEKERIKKYLEKLKRKDINYNALQ